MTMAETDTDLDALFAAARRDGPVLPAPLFEAMLADADREQAARLHPAAAPPRPVGRLRGWIGALGGWQAVSGLTAAAAAGIWIGIAAPDAVSAAGLGREAQGEAISLVELMPNYDEILTEG